MNRCLSCHTALAGGFYHPSCSLALFGTPKPPILDCTLEELYLWAKRKHQRGSVPGVQPKMSALQTLDRLEVTDISGDYIMKPQVPAYRALPENEALTMRMAATAGIEVAPCGLLPLVSGELVYVTQRMDRLVPGKRGLRRTTRHMEDFSQVTEHSTTRKYRGAMELVARGLRTYSDTPGLDLVRLLRLALFCFLTGNADMHLKNFSLLYEGRTKRLAPAYDLLSTRLVIPERDDPEEMALTLNGKKNRLRLEDFALFAKNIGLGSRQFQSACDSLAASLPSLFNLVQASFLPDDLKEAYGALLRVRAQRLGLVH